MITIHYSSHYLSQRKKYLKNNSRQVKQLISTIVTFAQNPRHPSLRLEKLQSSEVWTIRINKGDRVFFRWINYQQALLIDIGPHDKYRQY